MVDGGALPDSGTLATEVSTDASDTPGAAAGTGGRAKMNHAPWNGVACSRMTNSVCERVSHFLTRSPSTTGDGLDGGLPALGALRHCGDIAVRMSQIERWLSCGAPLETGDGEGSSNSEGVNGNGGETEGERVYDRVSLRVYGAGGVQVTGLLVQLVDFFIYDVVKGKKAADLIVQDGTRCRKLVVLDASVIGALMSGVLQPFTILHIRRVVCSGGGGQSPASGHASSTSVDVMAYEGTVVVDVMDVLRWVVPHMLFSSPLEAKGDIHFPLPILCHGWSNPSRVETVELVDKLASHVLNHASGLKQDGFSESEPLSAAVEGCVGGYDSAVQRGAYDNSDRAIGHGQAIMYVECSSDDDDTLEAHVYQYLLKRVSHRGNVGPQYYLVGGGYDAQAARETRARAHCKRLAVLSGGGLYTLIANWLQVPVWMPCIRSEKTLVRNRVDLSMTWSWADAVKECALAAVSELEGTAPGRVQSSSAMENAQADIAAQFVKGWIEEGHSYMRLTRPAVKCAQEYMKAKGIDAGAGVRVSNCAYSLYGLAHMNGFMDPQRICGSLVPVIPHDRDEMAGLLELRTDAYSNTNAKGAHVPAAVLGVVTHMTSSRAHREKYGGDSGTLVWIHVLNPWPKNVGSRFVEVEHVGVSDKRGRDEGWIRNPANGVPAHADQRSVLGLIFRGGACTVSIGRRLGIGDVLLIPMLASDDPRSSVLIIDDARCGTVAPYGIGCSQVVVHESEALMYGDTVLSKPSPLSGSVKTWGGVMKCGSVPWLCAERGSHALACQVFNVADKIILDTMMQLRLGSVLADLSWPIVPLGGFEKGCDIRTLCGYVFGVSHEVGVHGAEEGSSGAAISYPCHVGAVVSGRW